jgi:hypothetical protein
VSAKNSAGLIVPFVPPSQRRSCWTTSPFAYESPELWYRRPWDKIQACLGREIATLGSETGPLHWSRRWSVTQGPGAEHYFTCCLQDPMVDYPLVLGRFFYRPRGGCLQARVVASRRRPAGVFTQGPVSTHKLAIGLRERTCFGSLPVVVCSLSLTFAGLIGVSEAPSRSSWRLRLTRT